ncbi:carbohydrate-binding protein [Glycomyces dulcitolivorans]|uniref:carbohydrate-binding protein n=1 Tax=Glycomyces dulcitolivorans TaxID=2200759 RepID=UPI0038CC0275
MDVDFGGGGSETGQPTDPATTTSPGTGAGCSAGAWSASAVYTAGNQVTHEGIAYTASWWTTGEEPGTTGQWGVWKQTATC